MGLFNANAPLLADLNLLFQIAIFVFLVVGLPVVKLRRGFMKHGGIMAIAVALNTVSLVLVMVPSLLRNRGLFEMPFTIPVLIIFAHSIMGSLVEALGLWIAGTWLFRRREIKACVKKKTVMRATFSLWLIELILGIYVYIMLYLSV